VASLLLQLARVFPVRPEVGRVAPAGQLQFRRGGALPLLPSGEFLRTGAELLSRPPHELPVQPGAALPLPANALRLQHDAAPLLQPSGELLRLSVGLQLQLAG